MSGIGCIIIILEVGPLLGHEAAGEGVLATLQVMPSFFGRTQFPCCSIGVDDARDCLSHAPARRQDSTVAEVLEGVGIMQQIRLDYYYATRLEALRHAAYVAGSKHAGDRPPARMENGENRSP